LFLFLLNSVLFGVGLAMDAFSVSMANGLKEPSMPKSRMALIAGVFGTFQVLMPLAGWLCVRTVAEVFTAFQKCIPWIALVLLLYIGGKMLFEGLRGTGCAEASVVGFYALMAQGVATSVDALSVGFTIADYPAPKAILEALIIGVVTFGICIMGLLIGCRFGTKLQGKTSVLGGAILIAIGIEIFVTGLI
jgi:putative Mn2+ efflux pump MntP